MTVRKTRWAAARFRTRRALAVCALWPLVACANVLGIGAGELRDAERDQGDASSVLGSDAEAPAALEAGADASTLDAAAAGLDASRLDAEAGLLAPDPLADAASTADVQLSDGEVATDAAPLPDAAPICPVDAECCADSECSEHRPCVQYQCATTSCVAGYRFCSGQCLPLSSCCTRDDCGSGLVCNRGSCAPNYCNAGETPCGDTCIGSTQCCVDESCAGHRACVDKSCSTSTCATGYSACGDKCLGDGQCCDHADCAGRFACVGNACSTTQCAPGFRSCGQSCIPSSSCCAHSECSGNLACAAGACSTTQCAPGYWMCGSRCIPSSGCCSDGECNGFLCTGNTCSTTSCAAGFKRCGSSCIPNAHCCVDSDCANHFACVAGACSTHACAPTRCGLTCDMSTTCRPNYMFLSSRTFTIETLGGLAGADKACQQLASAAGLPGTFKAWLDTGKDFYTPKPGDVLRTLSARLVDGAGRLPSGWVRPDGRPFINDVREDRVFYPPKVDETGKLLDGSRDVHDWALLGGCNGLTPGTPGDELYTGSASMGSRGWWLGGHSNCTWPFHLYCFGTDYQAKLEISAPPAGRKAFAAAGWPGGSGLAGADAFCQQNASNAGLSGTYRALLASTSQSAAGRFSFGAGTTPWVRVDGVRIVDNPADLFATKSQIAASLNVSAAGAYFGYESVWTGVGNNGPQVTDATAASCNDFSSASSQVQGLTGTACGTRSNDVIGWHGSERWCNSPQLIYCLER